MMMLRRLRQAGVRRLHAHAGDHHHHDHEPPRFLGMKPNRTPDPFELPVIVFLLSLGVMAGLHVLAPETRLTEWAKDEAEERLRRREAGEDVEFGRNYFQERINNELRAMRKRKE